ncbi:hypothetical protein DENSPDRAFT_80563 [Dentipellis sp. KUC8613]|nr:hypothetical protein DENSPDRAFT_80563 [Dentipellis sp. KUC8613]
MFSTWALVSLWVQHRYPSHRISVSVHGSLHVRLYSPARPSVAPPSEASHRRRRAEVAEHGGRIAVLDAQRRQSAPYVTKLEPGICLWGRRRCHASKAGCCADPHAL